MSSTSVTITEKVRKACRSVRRSFERREISVRDRKGQKDRMTMLPERAIEPLWVHLERVRELPVTKT